MNRILAALFVGIFIFPISAGMAETTENMKEDLRPYLPDVSTILSLRPGWKSQGVTETVRSDGAFKVRRYYTITPTGTWETKIQHGKSKVTTRPDRLSATIEISKLESFEQAQNLFRCQAIPNKTFKLGGWVKKINYGQTVLPGQLICFYSVWRGDADKRIFSIFKKGKYIVDIEIGGNDDDYLAGMTKEKKEKYYPLVTQASVPTLDDLEKLANLMDSKIPSLGAQAPAQQPYLLKFETDKTVYETGERILLKGSVSKLVDVDRCMSEGVKKAPLRLRVEFPQVKVKPSELNFIGDKIITDDVGEFSFAPFACAAEGNLTMTALLSTQDYPKLEKDITAKISVKIVPAPIPTETQVEELITVFKKEVPSHRKEVEEGCNIYGNTNKLINAELLLVPYGYGQLNNMYFGFNGFHCYGYQVKTMRFLNGVRFSKNEGRSRLLRGLEYGPIMRGVQAERGPCGEHHAIALYRRNEDWKTAARVMDPWPMQKPEVFSIEDFRKFYGSETFDLGRWTVQESPIWTRCVPMLQPGPRTDGQIYWNLEIKQLGFDYPEDPSEGIEKSDSISVFSPVMLRITDSQGRRIGLGDKRELVAEIPGSQLFVCPHEGGGYLWYASFPHGIYTVEFLGTADGICHSLVRQAENTFMYTLPVRKNESALLKLQLDKEAQPVVTANRNIHPVKLFGSTLGQTPGQTRVSGRKLLSFAIGAVVLIALLIILRTRNKP